MSGADRGRPARSSQRHEGVEDRLNKVKRRWWLVALLVAVVVAAAIAAGVFLLNRGKSSGVHYLTSTAVTGTIAETVQADFTLTNSSDALTISLGGTSSSSSDSSGMGLARPPSPTGGSHRSITLDRTIIADGVSTPARDGPSRHVPFTAPAITALIPTSGPVEQQRDRRRHGLHRRHGGRLPRPCGALYREQRHSDHDHRARLARRAGRSASPLQAGW